MCVIFSDNIEPRAAKRCIFCRYIFQDKISSGEGFQVGFHTLLAQIVIKGCKGVILNLIR